MLWVGHIPCRSDLVRSRYKQDCPNNEVTLGVIINRWDAISYEQRF